MRVNSISICNIKHTNTQIINNLCWNQSILIAWTCYLEYIKLYIFVVIIIYARVVVNKIKIRIRER
jgi:hypothetical protein